MKIKYVAFVVLCMMSRYTYAVPAVADYVYDGDTFAAYVSIAPDVDISVRVRLINIDTPEIHGKCKYEITRANMARARLMELIPAGTVIDLQNIKDDKYLGRIDANVILPDGRNVGQVLINEKLGRPYGGGKRAGWCE